MKHLELKELTRYLKKEFEEKSLNIKGFSNFVYLNRISRNSIYG